MTPQATTESPTTEIEAVTKNTAIQELNSIAESFGEQSAQYRRDILVVSKIKRIGKSKEDMRAMNLYEATAYFISCRDLGLNPMLNHVIMLEGDLYITLAGHLQNAHASGNLKSIKTEITADDGKRKFLYKCIIQTKDGGEYDASGYADDKNVKGSQYKTDLFIQQMAEARAMRRCLSRAFPVGMPSYEDTQDSNDFFIEKEQPKILEDIKREVKPKEEKKPIEKEPEIIEKEQVPEIPEEITEEIPEEKEEFEINKPVPKEEKTEKKKMTKGMDEKVKAHQSATMEDPQFKECFGDDKKEELEDDLMLDEEEMDAVDDKLLENAEDNGIDVVEEKSTKEDKTLSREEDEKRLTGERAEARDEFKRLLSDYRANPNDETRDAKNAAAEKVDEITKEMIRKGYVVV